MHNIIISLLHQTHVDIWYNNKKGLKKYSHNAIISQDYRVINFIQHTFHKKKTLLCLKRKTVGLT